MVTPVWRKALTNYQTKISCFFPPTEIRQEEMPCSSIELEELCPPEMCRTLNQIPCSSFPWPCGNSKPTNAHRDDN